jgi:hypothetical protein
MLVRAPATRPGPSAPAPAASPGGGENAAVLTFARYLDVVLVVASAPFVLLAGMPTLGFVLGAVGWIVIRFGVEVIRRRAWAARDTRVRAVLHVTAIMGRVWLIAVVVLAARFGGHTDDGITAAVVVLAAFTVELAMSFVLRGPMPPSVRRPL